MFINNRHIEVYLCLGYTDMRKSINGLSIIVSDILDQDPFSGHIFAFCNRARKILKVLYWDKNGFCLWQKRLDKGKFIWPLSESDQNKISSQQFRWLLDGLEINQNKAFPSENFKYIF